jgi:hypothetical protein
VEEETKDVTSAACGAPLSPHPNMLSWGSGGHCPPPARELQCLWTLRGLELVPITLRSTLPFRGGFHRSWDFSSVPLLAQGCVYLAWSRCSVPHLSWRHMFQYSCECLKGPRVCCFLVSRCRNTGGGDSPCVFCPGTASASLLAHLGTVTK